MLEGLLRTEEPKSLEFNPSDKFRLDEGADLRTDTIQSFTVFYQFHIRSGEISRCSDNYVCVRT